MLPASALGFVLFLLVNVTLFLRPADMWPSWEGLPVYEGLILGAFVLSLQRMQRLFWPTEIRSQPITICVLGLLVAVVMSHLMHMFLWGVNHMGTEFTKTLIYYTTLVAVVSTAERLKILLLTVAVAASVMVGLCVVDFLGIQEFEFIKHLEQKEEGTDIHGERIVVTRMRGTGIFQDPNDIAMLIVAAGVLCTYFLTDRSTGFLRYGWLMPLAVLGTGLILTRSRGGLLSMAGAGAALMAFRYGRKGIMTAGLGALCVLPLAAGRQAEIDLEGGTGHDRILLWRDGLEYLKSADFLFGIGAGSYADFVGLVAHNSFVHSFVELGLFGGTLFLGCFFFPLLALYRTMRPEVRILHPELKRFLPYLGALLAGWCTAMLSLSRCYVVPTYLVIGIASATLLLVTPHVRPAMPLIYWNRNHMVQLLFAGGGVLAGMVAFVKLFAR
ncbi:MAG: O-antigen ligase family protein [Planctomycetaceae bacterium]|nr:O-antigen ligase family protein [Planctomycetaceae bacterium]